MDCISIADEVFKLFKFIDDNLIQLVNKFFILVTKEVSK